METDTKVGLRDQFGPGMVPAPLAPLPFTPLVPRPYQVEDARRHPGLENAQLGR